MCRQRLRKLLKARPTAKTRNGKCIGLGNGRAVGLGNGRAVGLGNGRAVGLGGGCAVGLGDGCAVGLGNAGAVGLGNVGTVGWGNGCAVGLGNGCSCGSLEIDEIVGWGRRNPMATGSCRRIGVGQRRRIRFSVLGPAPILWQLAVAVGLG